MTAITPKPLTWFRVPAQVRKSFDEADSRLLGESMQQKQLLWIGANLDGALFRGVRRFRPPSRERRSGIRSRRVSRISVQAPVPGAFVFHIGASLYVID
jgi:hypothetical protein